MYKRQLQITTPEIVPSPPPTLTPLASKEPLTPVSPNNPKVDIISELIAPVNDESNMPSSGKKGGSLKLASKNYFDLIQPILKKYNIPLIADGGIRFSGDISKAIALWRHLF